MSTQAWAATNDRPAKYILIGVIAVFIPMLGVGWKRMIEPVFSANFVLFAWLIGFFIAGLAVVLASGVASEKVKLKMAELAGMPHSDSTWMFYFAMLFAFSALGTMNAAFFVGEGHSVIIESSDTALRTLDQMQSKAVSVLASPQFLEKKSRVDGLLVSLAEEIHNRRNCGEGPEARKILAEITAELPTFHRLSGITKNCTGIDSVIRSYKDQAAQLLTTSPEYVTANLGKKDAFIVTLNERVSAAKATLVSTKFALSEAGSGNSDALSAAKNALESAATTYATLLVDLEQLSDKPNALPRSIEVNHARQLGSISQIIPSLMSRLDRLSTYLYIFAAVFFDLILIRCFMRVAMGEAMRANAVASKPAAKKIPDGKLRFIWVNP